MVLTQRNSLQPEQKRKNQFPYHYGSHATRCLCWLNQQSRVSIPLWFSRNSFKDYSRRIQWSSFPYHYGSHATGKRPRKQFRNGKFPYHYGSHATNAHYSKRSKEQKFPYHYGSHATGYLDWDNKEISSFHTTMVLTQLSFWSVLWSKYVVSIPLWFSRNKLKGIGCTRC